jgi:hypothetical protein
MIIGLSGHAGSGKDTAAAGLQGYYQLAFAKPLKDGAKPLFDLTDEQLYGKLKEKPDNRWSVSPREIMQYLGDHCREYNPNFFVINMRSRIEKSQSQGIKNIVITDVRYNNEAKLIHELGGKVIKIERKITTTKHSKHSSEQGILTEFIDYTVQNDGTIEQLIKKIKHVTKYRNV